MPTAKKLPSGSWNCRVFSHYEYDRDTGKKKRVYKSFTCNDPSRRGKKECERKAAEWSVNRRAEPDRMDVHAAIAGYISAKENVLSPSTIRAYRAAAKSAYRDIDHLSLFNLTASDVQSWVNKIAVENSPKTVRNKYALLEAALCMYGCENFQSTLPARVRPDTSTPSDSDVKRLLEHARTLRTDDLYISIMLSAFCSLRRGEICALTSDDLNGNVLTVSKCRVLDSDGAYTNKQPKTYSGYREVVLPLPVVNALAGKKGRLVAFTPAALSDSFRRAAARVFGPDGPHYRFHDLRHYYASVSHAIGVPDEYIMKSGGWKTDHVMKSIYRTALPDYESRQSAIISSHCSDVLSGIS